MEDFYCSEIISGKTEVEIIFETDSVMAFHHTDPYFEQHVVIIPKAHITSLSEYPNTPELNQDIFKAITLVSKQLEEDYGGCRVSSNVGDYQSTKHLHWYVHHGKRLRTEEEHYPILVVMYTLNRYTKTEQVSETTHHDDYSFYHS